MSGSILCRLCRTICDDSSISLRDTNGNPNDVYDTTIKFFHPTFLEVEYEAASLMAVLCINCWHHISSFNIFKHNVLLIQANFLKSLEEGHYNIEPNQVIVAAQDHLIVPENTTQFVITEYDDKLPVDVKKESDAVLPPEHSLGTDEMALSKLPLKFENNADELLVPSHTENDFNGDQAEEDLYGDPLYSPKSSVDSIFEPSNTRVTTRKNKFSRRRRNNLKAQKELDVVLSLWKTSLKCYSCPETFKNFSKLQDHVWKEHPQAEFYTSCCARNFKYLSHFLEHARLHTNTTNSTKKKKSRTTKSILG